MTYLEAVDYLYNRTPLFQNVGQGAYKEGLSNTLALDEHFGHPHQYFQTIHIAGTNGKGSCSHTIASILQEAGYKVGLYTSPHLLDFRERIRVNGQKISEEAVIAFIETHHSFFEPLHPSFFEVTTALAFKYFAEEKVDVAVVEVGLGGRLDCTNIVTPRLSIITNISFDHVQFLGDTLSEIAAEKAGIMKPRVPVVIGETTPETKKVFQDKANEVGAPLFFAEESQEIASHEFKTNGDIAYQTRSYGTIQSEMGGFYQIKNTNTILRCIPFLKEAFPNITQKAIQQGFHKICSNTGLMGRWQHVADSPRTYCDTGHNIGGFEYISKQLRMQSCHTLRIVMGMVNDKDINGVLSLLPSDAVYYFCQASVKRALPHFQLKDLAMSHHLQGTSYPSVSTAYKAAKCDASTSDFIFVGGSTFVVADFLSFISAV